MKSIFHYRKLGIGLLAGAVLLSAGVAFATHSWGPYHWARSANPFTLKLGDNMSSAWDPYLVTASSDWSASTVLDTTIVAGGTRARTCKATTGRVEVCSAAYGNTGWLGVAQIWIDGNNHIAQGTAKMNDTYFSTASYNTPSWKQMVVCQEIAHTFGLDHQDENFNNANLGTCMDYTSNPDGPPSNLHPNAHDFAQLETIYAHLDSYATLLASAPSGPGKSGLAAGADVSDQSEWGAVLRRDGNGQSSLYGRDLGNGEKVFTFVLWAHEK